MPVSCAEVVQHGDESSSISRFLGTDSQRRDNTHHSALRGQRVSEKRVYQGEETSPCTSYPSPPSTAGGSSPRRPLSPGSNNPFSTDAEPSSSRSTEQIARPLTGVPSTRRKPSIQVSSLLADPQVKSVDFPS